MNESVSESNFTDVVDCEYSAPMFLEGRFWVVSVFGTSVAIICSIENAFLFCTLARKKQHLNSHCLYLTLLALFDFFIGMSYIPLMSISLLADYLQSPVLLSAWYFYMRPMITISHIAMTASSFLILAASFERYCITCFPGRLRKVQQWRRTIAVCAILGGVITKITLYHEFTIKFNPGCVGTMQEYNLMLSSMATEYYYNLFWRLGFRNLVTVLMPFFGLLIMNFLIVRKLKKVHGIPSEQKVLDVSRELNPKKRVRAATRTLLLIVFCYLMANVLNVILTLWEYFDMESLTGPFLKFYMYSVDIISILTILAGSFRLPIYAMCMPQLRKDFVNVFKTLTKSRHYKINHTLNNHFQYGPVILRISEMLMKYPTFSAETSFDDLSYDIDEEDEKRQEVFL